MSADGYRYKTNFPQDRISLINCLGAYNTRKVFSRPFFGRGLLARGVGPEEVLYRFDCWITQDRPDLRSQLDKLLKEHEGN